MHPYPSHVCMCICLLERHPPECPQVSVVDESVNALVTLSHSSHEASLDLFRRVMCSLREHIACAFDCAYSKAERRSPPQRGALQVDRRKQQVVKHGKTYLLQ